MKLLPPFTEFERKKSPVDPEYSSEFELDDDDRSLLATAARVPVAISMAAGASTALIVCHDDGATDSSSTSACCCRSLALCFWPTAGAVLELGSGVDEPVVDGVAVVLLLPLVVGVVDADAAVVGGTEAGCCWLEAPFDLRPPLGTVAS